MDMLDQVYLSLINVGEQALEFVLLLIPALIVFFIWKFIAKKLSKAFQWSYQKTTQWGLDKTGKFIRDWIYYFLLIVTLIAVFDILQIAILSDLFAQVVLIIPEFVKWLAIGSGLAVAWEGRQELLAFVKNIISSFTSK